MGRLIVEGMYDGESKEESNEKKKGWMRDGMTMGDPDERRTGFEHLLRCEKTVSGERYSKSEVSCAHFKMTPS